MSAPATKLKLFAKGDIVLVSGEAGDVLGFVLEANRIEEMPHLGEGSDSKRAVDLLREMRVDVLLLIGHDQDEKPIRFWALHTPDGWVDLHDQKLTVLKGYPVGRG